VSYAHGLDYLLALHACFYCGIVPICISPPDTHRLKEDIPNLLELVDDFKATCILTHSPIDELLKSKQVTAFLKSKEKDKSRDLPNIINTTKAAKSSKFMEESSHDVAIRKMSARLKFGTAPEPGMSSPVAMIQVHVNADARQTCMRFSHQVLLDQCHYQKQLCQMTAARPLISTLESNKGLGLLHSFILGIYVGCHTLVVSSPEYYANSSLWLDLVNKFKIKDAVVSGP
jgi:acyl-CoA synthetase (AMP-forming)/AMP-acid ligase II